MRCASVDGGDRGLEGVGADTAGGERALDEARAVVDVAAIPERAVLVGEEHDLALGRRARRAPRFLQQHERQQAHGLGLGQELHQQAAQPDRLPRQVVSSQ